MAETQSGPGWSDTQSELIGNTVTEAFNQASVAGKFLSCDDRKSEGSETVPQERVRVDGNEVSVRDDTPLKLFTLAVKVPLRKDLGAGDRMGNVGIAGLAKLALVGALAELVRVLPL